MSGISYLEIWDFEQNARVPFLKLQQKQLGYENVHERIARVPFLKLQQKQLGYENVHPAVSNSRNIGV